MWGSFVAPFATAQQAFAGTNADQHLLQIMRVAGAYGAVKFLRGPVLATLRRPPFPARDLVSEGLLAEGSRGGGEGREDRVMWVSFEE